MKHQNQYRLVKVTKSNGPGKADLNQTGQKDEHVDNRDASMTAPRRHHPVLWILGVVIVALIVISGIWMSSVSTSLGHMNQTVTGNSAMLSHQSTQLAALQTKLGDIGQQLNQLEDEIRNFFTSAMNALQKHQ